MKPHHSAVYAAFELAFSWFPILDFYLTSKIYLKPTFDRHCIVKSRKLYLLSEAFPSRDCMGDKAVHPEHLISSIRRQSLSFFLSPSFRSSSRSKFVFLSPVVLFCCYVIISDNFTSSSTGKTFSFVSTRGKEQNKNLVAPLSRDE